MVTVTCVSAAANAGRAGALSSRPTRATAAAPTRDPQRRTAWRGGAGLGIIQALSQATPALQPAPGPHSTVPEPVTGRGDVPRDVSVVSCPPVARRRAGAPGRCVWAAGRRLGGRVRAKGALRA